MTFNKKNHREQLEQICRPVIDNMGFDLILIETVTHRGRFVLRMYIDSKDGDRGVTLEDCAAVSRRVSTVLDVEDPMPDRRYLLEVSSPGLDRPLVCPRDFRKFIGKKANIRLKRSPDRTRRKYRGAIKAVTETEVSLELEDERQTQRFSFESIEKANLVADL